VRILFTVLRAWLKTLSVVTINNDYKIRSRLVSPSVCSIHSWMFHIKQPPTYRIGHDSARYSMSAINKVGGGLTTRPAKYGKKMTSVVRVTFVPWTVFTFMLVIQRASPELAANKVPSAVRFTPSSVGQ
jgi:hypothetical protein